MIEQIEGYLSQYGWEFRRAEDGTIVTNFASGDLSFLVTIQLDQPWLRISAPSFLPLQAISAANPLPAQLLRLNHHTRLVRFALDADDAVTLCLDLFLGKPLEYEEFEVALNAIVYIADTVYQYLFGESQAESFNGPGENSAGVGRNHA